MTAAAPRPFAYLSEFANARPRFLTTFAEAPSPSADSETELLPYWEGIIGEEGQLTGDGRLIEAESLEWDAPSPFRFVKEDVGGHQNAVSVGRILSVTRQADGKLYAYGDYDLGSEDGREAARLCANGVQAGVSMDLDSVEFEVRVAAEIMEAQQALWDALDAGEDLEPQAHEVDADGRVTVYKGGPDDEVMVITAARLRAATQVSIPAFAGATISPLAQLPTEIMALVASAAPVDPPASWFSRPEADGPTALTITEEGEVYGHLATWDVCHTADPNGAGVCVMAPKSKSQYAYFHTGSVKTAEGSYVSTGPLRFNTQHASLRLSADSASAHYDHTGLAGADVHVIDGKHGIWVSGALRPGVTEEQVRTLRASPLSGDWRYIQGELELVGALAVNLPGFPIPRPRALVASGEMTGMVAAGMVATKEAVHVRQFTSSEARLLRKMIERETRSAERQVLSRAQAVINQRKVAEMSRKRAAGVL